MRAMLTGIASVRRHNMKLTEEEQKICDKYGSYDDTGRVRCFACPLCISNNPGYGLECYATIDEESQMAKELKRK